MCMVARGQFRLMWLHWDDTGLEMIMIVIAIVVIVAKVLHLDDIVFAMMGSTIQLPLRSVMRVSVESGLMAIVARLDLMQRLCIMRHRCHSWI